jgi:hypothetical protein
MVLILLFGSTIKVNYLTLISISIGLIIVIKFLIISWKEERKGLIFATVKEILQNFLSKELNKIDLFFILAFLHFVFFPLLIGSIV